MSIDGLRGDRSVTSDVTTISDEYTFTGNGVINPSRRYHESLESLESLEARRSSTFSSLMDTPLRFFRLLTSGISSFFGTVASSIQDAFIAVWSLTPFSSLSASESSTSSVSSNSSTISDESPRILTSRDLLEAKKAVIENPNLGISQKLVAFVELLQLEVDSSLTREALQEELNTIFASDEFPNDLKWVITDYGVSEAENEDEPVLVQFADINYPTFIVSISMAVALLPDRIFRKHEASFLNGDLPLHERLAHFFMSAFCGEDSIGADSFSRIYENLNMDRSNQREKQAEFLDSNPMNQNNRPLLATITNPEDLLENLDLFSSLKDLKDSYPSLCLSIIDVCIKEYEETPSLAIFREAFPYEILASICSEYHCNLEVDLTTDALKRQAFKDCLLNPKLPREVTDAIFSNIAYLYTRPNYMLSDAEYVEIGKLSFERAGLNSNIFNSVLQDIRTRAT